jgi:PKD repeat protein
MIKISRTSFFICLALLFAALFFVNSYSLKVNKSKTSFQNVNEDEEGNIPLKDRMDLAMKQEVELTKDPATGKVPRERLYTAYLYSEQLVNQNQAYRISAAIPGVKWQERGPDNVAGRTLAIMIDPNDVSKKTLWVGAAGGGLWKTTDITPTQPAWNVVNDFFNNLAVTTITYNPLNTQEFYFGTGESWYNADAVRGDGIWKSTNGGTTWTQLASTASNTNFNWIQKIIIHPVTGDIYAATRAGVFRSTNGGTSWTQVLGNGNGCVSNDMGDIEIAADNSLYVAVGSIFSSDGIYKSSNGNTGSWTKLNIAASGLPLTATPINRIELACAPSSATTVYAIISSGAGLYNIYKTTNGGTTWTTLTVPAWRDQNCGTPSTDFTRGQAWYDLTAIVDPNNVNNVFIGGVDIFKTSNGGTTWTQLTNWAGLCGYQYAHADQHTMIYEPGNSNIMYFGNDGGIFRTANATAAVPAIVDRDLGYNVTQFYACAMNPTAYSNQFMAGAQDNGTQQLSSLGVGSAVEVTGGDGCFCHIDQDQPQYQFTSYVYNNYYRSTNGGCSFSSLTNNNNGSFVNPTDYDNLNNNLYACNGNGNYYRILNAPATNVLTSINIAAFNSGRVTSVSVSPNTANRVFFGLNNGRVVMVDNAHAATPTGTNITGAGMPGGSVSCIAIETGNDNHLLATYSNYGSISVWETTNGGMSWTSVEGNIPDMPVRWALFNPLNNTQAMLATELGVWSTDFLNGGATNWMPTNTGFANVRTDMLQLRTSDNLVLAATHGRGMYTTDVFCAPHADFLANKTVVYLNDPVSFTDQSLKATSWLWNFGDASTSGSQNPTHSYSAPGYYTITLTINGPANVVKANYILVLPNRGTPYTTAMGGNFDVNPNDFGSRISTSTSPCAAAPVTNFERGNSAIAGKNGTFSGSFAWVTGLTQTNYSDNTDAILLTPNFNFSAAGAYTLRFYRKNSFEIGFDGFRVEYSLNKGNTWSPLGAVIANWYDFANSATTTSFSINEPYFNSTRGTFTLAQWDVSPFAGNSNVAFRFHFKSDVNTTAPGVAIDDFEIIAPVNPPLPVELLSFTGKAEKDFNLLQWETGSENNNKGFDVERSATGDDFQKIGSLNGNGNSTINRSYTFDDRDLLKAIYYYRLKQIDFNGNFKYSHVIAVRREIPNNSGVQFIYPNPLSDELNIILNTERRNKLSVALYDIRGKKLFNKNFSPENYAVNIDLKPFDLSQGMYLIYIIADGEIFSQKLFKN